MLLHLNPGFDPHNHEPLAALSTELGLPAHIEVTDFGPRAFSEENRKNSPCFYCAWLRRKRLFDLCAAYGLTHLAFGHNADDLASTFFLNLFQNGRVDGLSCRESFFGGRLTVIRPLLLVDKRTILRAAKAWELPVFANPCPMNVASTRLILLHGDEGTSAAGHVIQAFGQFVVGGNYAIGCVIFLLLFAINKKVIVAGTTRIAEVAARFTLDAMDYLEGKISYLLVDTGAGINDNVIYFNLAARERLLVLTTEPTSLTDAYALIKVMTGYSVLVIFLTVCELALLWLVVLFFSRLRRSEGQLAKLQLNQDTFLKKLDFNARLEQELVSSFQNRQAELAELDQKLEQRRAELEKLVKKAEEITRSPEFLRQVILNGARRGQSPQALAKATGLALDEVELILAQQGG